MRTSAELDGKPFAHGQHAHLIAILLAKQRHCATRPRTVHIGQLGLHRRVGADLFVDQSCNRAQLLVCQRLEMRKVETQMLCIDERSLLHHMCAQHLAQCRVQQMGGRVIARRRCTNSGLDTHIDHRTCTQ